MIEFLYPKYFLLLPIPFLLRMMLPHSKESRDMAIVLPFYETFKKISKKRKYISKISKFRFSLLFLWLTWFFLVISIARPCWVGDPLPVKTKARNLIMAIDLSGSMAQEDFEIRGSRANRLEIVKLLAKDFIKKRQGDKIGLVLFGTRAYLQAPMTLDIGFIEQILSEVDIAMAGKQTAIGDAIGLAMKVLRKKNTKQKTLILLTDGTNNAGELKIDEAISLAKSQKAKIYTIGIGAKEIVTRSFFGARVVNPSKDLDEKSLKKIANQTGGKYYRATDTQSLKEIYQKIDELEPIKSKQTFVRPKKELFYIPLMIAFFISSFMALYKAFQGVGIKKEVIR